MPESVRNGVRLDIINGFRGVNAAYNHVETRQLELVTALKKHGNKTSRAARSNGYAVRQ
jgi:hypothetical protein